MIFFFLFLPSKIHYFFLVTSSERHGIFHNILKDAEATGKLKIGKTKPSKRNLHVRLVCHWLEPFPPQFPHPLTQSTHEFSTDDFVHRTRSARSLIHR